MKHVIIAGAGFAGINAANCLGNKPNIKVTLIDKRNHHIFQPLLYQVAMAGLSPAEIARPIRALLSRYRNITVLQTELKSVDPENNRITTDFKEMEYDYLLLACGANHSYFGNNHWESYAPGLKNIEQATEIRRRVLSAFEVAERTEDPQKQKEELTFVIVGGGPTGVELAGAIGEMSKFTLSKDFRNINPRLTKIILIEAGEFILNDFAKSLRKKATKDLLKLGVHLWTSCKLTDIKEDRVVLGEKEIKTKNVLWAAGIEAFDIGKRTGFETDNLGRIKVEKDLSIKNYKNIFAAGDLACFKHKTLGDLPPLAPVAMQEGKFIAKNIINEVQGGKRKNFSFMDKGKMATIGRSKAIVEFRNIKVSGFFAWLIWLFIHIYYLSGFMNKFFVFVNWTWSYLSFKKGARLILTKKWRSHDSGQK